QKDEEKQKSKVKLSPPKLQLVPYRRPISAANAQPPKKGILKTTPQPNTRPLWKRDWLSTLNTRIQNVTNVASTSPTTTSFLMTAFKRLNVPYSPQEEQPPKPSSPLQIDTTLPADQISQQSSSLVNSSLLSQKSLKRVRFSVAKLTDEYPHSPIPCDSDDSDWEDEYDFREWSENQKRNAPSHPEPEKKVYSAKEIVQYYLAACKYREEFPLDRLVTIFRRASQPGGSLKIIDLTGDIIDRRIAEPMADVLTLECGLRKLILERCEIEDDTLKILCHSLLVNDTLSYLSLSNNKRLRSNGFHYIALYIKKSKSLTYLDLSGTNIDKKSVTFLAQALIQGSNRSGSILETLKLDSCGLKNNGLEVLGPGVRRSNLKYLSLRYNRISHVGAVWIGVMLRDYDDLNLEQTNSIRSEFDEYEEDKAEKLQGRHGLEVFDARGNEIKVEIGIVFE
ncbi:370_t:CDS:2, partial [Acaulospora morrowiae]